MITVDWNGLSREFTSILEAVAFQRELRVEHNSGSMLWNGDQLVREMYKDCFTGNWVVETPHTKFEIVS